MSAPWPSRDKMVVRMGRQPLARSRIGEEGMDDGEMDVRGVAEG